MVYPAHKPTEQNKKIVETMAVAGIPLDTIASIIEVNPKTLKKHYVKELSYGLAKANTQIAKGLYEKAMQGDVKAMMFWLERRGGEVWKANPQLQLTSREFKIEMSPTIEFLDDDTN